MEDKALDSGKFNNIIFIFIFANDNIINFIKYNKFKWRYYKFSYYFYFCI